MTLRTAALRVLAPAALLIAGGCSLPSQRADFRSNDPQERTLAVGEAMRTADRTSVPRLIELLASSDPAERMFAINALETLTGETRGYRHWAPERERREAVRRWVDWYAAAGPEGAGGPAEGLAAAASGGQGAGSP